jgi:thymidylate kinase
MIITISGLDGAGKTVQIEKLLKSLSNDGYKVKYVWARGGYTPGFEFLKNTLRRIFSKKLPPPGPSDVRAEKLGSASIQKLWLIIAIIDLIVLWGIYVRTFSTLNTVVICDRYLNDTLLDFRNNFPTSNIEDSIFWRLLTALVPDPDHSFLFWVPVDTSEKRSIAKGEPFPDTKETLEWRLNAYMDESTFPLNKYTRIDGRSSIKKISDELYSFVKSALRSK